MLSGILRNPPSPLVFPVFHPTLLHGVIRLMKVFFIIIFSVLVNFRKCKTFNLFMFLYFYGPFFIFFFYISFLHFFSWGSLEANLQMWKQNLTLAVKKKVGGREEKWKRKREKKKRMGFA